MTQPLGIRAKRAVGDQTVTACLRDLAISIGRRLAPPSIEGAHDSAGALSAVVAKLRADGVTRTRSDDGVARLFS